MIWAHLRDSVGDSIKGILDRIVLKYHLKAEKVQNVSCKLSSEFHTVVVETRKYES